MDAIEELQAKQACAELMARYALAVNTRDVEGFVGLFTPDGEWNRPGGHSMRGLPVPLTNPDMVVEYRDLLSRRDGRWLIRRRDTTVVFAARGLPAVPES